MFFSAARMSSYTLPNPCRKSIYRNLPVSDPARVAGHVFHKLLQFDSIIGFTRYIDALQFIHVYAGDGRKDNFSFRLSHRILHEWFIGVLPNNK